MEWSNSVRVWTRSTNPKGQGLTAFVSKQIEQSRVLADTTRGEAVGSQRIQSGHGVLHKLDTYRVTLHLLVLFFPTRRSTNKQQQHQDTTSYRDQQRIC